MSESFWEQHADLDWDVSAVMYASVLMTGASALTASSQPGLRPTQARF